MPTGIRFPVELPLPLRDGYALTYEDTRASAQPESGTARVRRVVRSEPRLESLVWSFTQAQYRVFDLWWHETIASGAREFDILLTDLYHNTVWFTARWIGDFEAEMTNAAYRWRVRGALRLLGESFADRPSGTDELTGRATVGVSASGNLAVEKLMFATARFEVVGAGRLSGSGGFLAVGVGITGTGRIPLGPLRGVGTLAVSAKADATQFGVGAPQVERVWVGAHAFRYGQSYDIASNPEAVRRSAMGLTNGI